MKNHVCELNLLLKGDSQFDREVRETFFKKASYPSNGYLLSSPDKLVLNNIKDVNELLKKNPEIYNAIIKSGFFASNNLEKFIDVTVYGLIRFLFVPIFFRRLKDEFLPSKAIGTKHFLKILLEYFSLGPQGTNLVLFTEIGSLKKPGLRNKGGLSGSSSFIKICFGTLLSFLKKEFEFNESSIVQITNDFTKISPFINFEEKKLKHSSNIFDLFERNLIYLMNANFICLKNEVPCMTVGRAGRQFVFPANQFLEIYRKELLNLLYRMDHYEHRKLRSLEGGTSCLRTLNRFPI